MVSCEGSITGSSVDQLSHLPLCAVVELQKSVIGTAFYGSNYAYNHNRRINDWMGSSLTGIDCTWTLDTVNPFYISVT